MKWRLGGGRTVPQQTERFKDQPSAVVFKEVVDEHGQQWPPGWVKGVGYVEDERTDLGPRGVTAVTGHDPEAVQADLIRRTTALVDAFWARVNGAIEEHVAEAHPEAGAPGQ
ncbi:hypothetical protein [Streptomyces sp. NPDC046685]|uniref:hypothetical protein n=1 Tax=Streptomyces sp. NPDC046685 TaxID=3157202 RepID=UPI0033FFC08A